MSDILFKTLDYIFSYRVAGICAQNGKVLLQKPSDDTSYAFPGGHVSFGETNEQTLIREFKEEIGADIAVGKLRWVGELFFPWGKKSCHQICLYYEISILSGDTPTEGMFPAREQLEGRSFTLEFHWVPLEKAKKIEICPSNLTDFLLKLDGGVELFVYREE